MKFLLSLSVIAILISSCTSYTRIEEDVYTITERDTTYESYVHNDSQNRDEGVISPSKKILLNERNIVLYDSVVKRVYPDFIRIGLLETAGLFGGNSDFAINSGIFGVHPNPFSALDNNNRGGDGFVPGGLYRMFIVEDRLRWFKDAPNWTWGVTGFEYLAPDARLERSMIGLGVMNLKWRYYLSKKIPYQAISVSGRMALWPSTYGGVEVNYELGSIGGLNTRAYLGYATGSNADGGLLDRQNEFSNGATSPSVFYMGLGVSFLDFVNIVPETYTEMKYMEHSAWNIGLLQFGLLTSNSEGSFLFEDEIDGLTGDVTPNNSPLKGFMLRFLNANLALPILNNKFYAGTSLLNMVVLSADAGGIGFMPLRVGYYQNIISDNLILEPFFEYNYLPSSFIHLGFKLNLTFDQYTDETDPNEGLESSTFNVALIGGYVNGDFFGNIDITDDLGSFSNFGEFSGLYLGISVGVQDRLFYPHELRYNK